MNKILQIIILFTLIVGFSISSYSSDIKMFLFKEIQIVDTSISSELDEISMLIDSKVNSCIFLETDENLQSAIIKIKIGKNSDLITLPVSEIKQLNSDVTALFLNNGEQILLSYPSEELNIYWIKHNISFRFLNEVSQTLNNKKDLMEFECFDELFNELD